LDDIGEGGSLCDKKPFKLSQYSRLKISTAPGRRKAAPTISMAMIGGHSTVDGDQGAGDGGAAMNNMGVVEIERLFRVPLSSCGVCGIEPITQEPSEDQG